MGDDLYILDDYSNMFLGADLQVFGQLLEFFFAFFWRISYIFWFGIFEDGNFEFLKTLPSVFLNFVDEVWYQRRHLEFHVDS